jgi:hypothetical protein
MNITIQTDLPRVRLPDVSLVFDRDTVAFEVRNDVGYSEMRDETHEDDDV